MKFNSILLLQFNFLLTLGNSESNYKNELFTKMSNNKARNVRSNAILDNTSNRKDKIHIQIHELNKDRHYKKRDVRNKIEEKHEIQKLEDQINEVHNYHPVKRDTTNELEKKKQSHIIRVHISDGGKRHPEKRHILNEIKGTRNTKVITGTRNENIVADISDEPEDNDEVSGDDTDDASGADYANVDDAVSSQEAEDSQDDKRVQNLGKMRQGDKEKGELICRRKCSLPMTYEECAFPRCDYKYKTVRDLCFWLCKNQRQHCQDVCEYE